MHTLTVATFNIRNSRAFDGRNSWILRRSATTTAIGAIDADVIGLQEVFARPLRFLLRRLRAYEAFGEGRSGGRRGESCPVLVKSRHLDVVHARTLWFGDEPERAGSRLPGATFPRVATTVRLRDPRSSVEMVVWNVHLDEHSAANRARSTAQLAGWIDRDLPTIVVGDFNAVPDDGAVFAPLHAAGLRSVLDDGGAGTAHAFTGRTDVPRLDHILVSADWHVETAAALTARPNGRLPSDHWPVRAVLRMR
jgi:endonuclease/exonuclease/phosphatase family metal-dependent hydrolase